MQDYQFVDGTRLSSVIEALIFASPEPISEEKICEIIAKGEENLGLEINAIEPFVEKLNQRYEENGLAFNIEHVAGGYTFSTKKRFEPWLSIFQHESAYRKLSQSAIETLAIVAYKQPITKPEVDDIRGVDSGYMLRQLLEKVLIEVSGRLDAPGKPLLYRTTKHFLKHFGINSIDELPKPREIEEILKDDDMAEHRQFLFDRQLELKELQETAEDKDATETAMSLIEAVEKIDEEEVPDLDEYTADVLQLDDEEENDEDDETSKELENESDSIQENLEDESTKKEEE
ncbi:SMC-Scp complex subunit ScpB [Aliifodinibius salipaludis]|uniref:SMC-Scp complex subunit ScpB n=1 Tax=Fodinibius salipaludis TaxID=2032627 RepID=A0A2A2G9C2_9BACT|nr:SMC-Scp complex subunit ScpB [Aliifodinibius salipaludis]PAU94181.1 SMC-Scp complex subunit ScpB [Aliifodinibius salipaludis]